MKYSEYDQASLKRAVGAEDHEYGLRSEYNHYSIWNFVVDKTMTLCILELYGSHGALRADYRRMRSYAPAKRMRIMARSAAYHGHLRSWYRYNRGFDEKGVRFQRDIIHKKGEGVNDCCKGFDKGL